MLNFKKEQKCPKSRMKNQTTEVSRLKNIIEAQSIEIGKAKKEALDWRNLCAELQKGAKMPEIKDEKAGWIGAGTFE